MEDEKKRKRIMKTEKKTIDVAYEYLKINIYWEARNRKKVQQAKVR